MDFGGNRGAVNQRDRPHPRDRVGDGNFNARGGGRGGFRGGFGGRGRGRGGERGRGGRGRGGRDREFRPREHPMGYHALEGLDNNEDNGEILQTLANRQSGFYLLLSSRDSLRPDLIKLTISVLAKACEYKGTPGTLLEVLNEVRESVFLREKLSPYYLEIMTTTSPLRFINPINNSLRLFQELLQRMPNSAENVFIPWKILDTAVKASGTMMKSLPEYIQQKIAEIGTLCQEIMESRVEKPEERTYYHPKSEEKPPPNDFRELPVIPTVGDVQAQEMPYLRVNKAEGAYEDLENYLDVQFRLLREDFIRPLRTGITDYLKMIQEGHMERKLSDIRIYNDVQVLYPVCTPNGVSHRIKFDVRHMRRVRWQNSKRLIYGSLLCLSRDNFNTLLFATVANRDPEILETGEVEVQFTHNLEDMNNIPPNEIFVMAETTAYFEAYRHVLNGLQTVDQQFPFQNYLVKGMHDMEIPKYVSQKRDEDFDMSCICSDIVKERKLTLKDVLDEMEGTHDESVLRDRLSQFHQEKKVKKVSLLDKQSWPTAERLQLDPSQFEALQAALTRELAIIQGPPGTGKTYIGLKIVKCLLSNKKFWAGENNPILVVCYTNHALDQFLEGIHEYCRENVVRVGGRSKSEALRNMNLRELRRKVRQNRSIPQAIHGGRINARSEMEELEKKMGRVGAIIASTEEGIIHEDVLQPFIEDDHFESLVAFFRNDQAANMLPPEYRKMIKRPSILVEWLGLGDFLWRHEQPDQPVDDQRPAPNQAEAVQAAAAALEQLEINDEEEIEAEEEAEIEERRREIEIYDLDHNEERERRQRINQENARRDMAFNIEDVDQPARDDQGWQVRREDRRQRKRKLRQGLQSTDLMSREEINTLRDLWALNLPSRWRLYRYWIGLYKENLREGIRRDEQQYQQAANRLKEIMNQEDAYVMKTAKVIGMTTTGAARYRDILQELKPKIVVVEEAAEVLEAHIVTTLSSGCEHLILIGDHKQLRPNPTVYELAERYNLKISLFERLINNGLPHVTLEKQHRMRPEISQFMKHIYPKLRDADSVYNYEAVKGVGKNVFFLNHNYEEDHDEELKSKGNHHEAKFVAELCKYLLFQGYKTNEITVLTPYTGQLVKLKRNMPKKNFEGMRICAIDNFQGEENEIIVISLVRSQKDKDLDSDKAKKLVGFLKEANRICVTLSRAKQGMYVVGNFDLFTKSNELWDKIITTAQKDGMYGTTLGLYCQNHPENKLTVKHSKDFKKSPEGGCMKPCDFRLPCGHVCQMVCHTRDIEHKEYKCMKQCGKVLCNNRHICRHPCYKECGPCTEPMEKIIPQCNHVQKVPCSVPPSKFKCYSECDHVLNCGHKCQKLCGESHTDMCRINVRRTLPCSHEVKLKCFEDPVKFKCPAKCSKALECGHPCAGSCGECKQGRIHKSCMKKCERVLVCGHLCKANCTKDCPPCSEPCRNRCVHSRCTKRCGEACQPCMEPCEWRCEHYTCTKRCHEECNRRRCNQPCKKTLPCKHPCIGMCGERCPNKCRICHKDEVEEIFFGEEDEEGARFVQLEDCGHLFEVSGLDTWMDMAIDTKGDGQNIQLKHCPKCKVPIRRNLRYGNITNSLLQDIERVKAKVAGDKATIQVKCSELKAAARPLANLDRKSYEIIYERLQGEKIMMGEVNVLENCITLLRSLYKMKKAVSKDFMFEVETGRDGMVKVFLSQLEEFTVWILESRQRFSEQELNEAKLEGERLQLFYKLCYINKRVKDRSAAAKLDHDLPELMENAQKRLASKQHLDENKRRHINAVIAALDKAVPASGLGISETERIEIVKAIGLSKGHWYKCPNGHVYAIGECGGATMETQCPECKATIGGTGHALASGNAHASEMDGSRHAAWSEQANLENYGFNAIF